jgi:hypothetical protein
VNMTQPADEKPPISVKGFLESVPPGSWTDVPNASSWSGGNPYLTLSDLELHCTTDSCNGVRFFQTSTTFQLTSKHAREAFISYTCRNCRKTYKTYAVRALLSEEDSSVKLYKLGEYPPFGPPSPARLISLIGAERDFFLKGRRSENQGLGIAAFAYYRRVIESQKNRILDEIIKVSEKLSTPDALIADLRLAQQETQFSTAVARIKQAIPQALLINGHNPLTLLHSALSEGLHAQTDEECLELATSIRVIMTDLAERLSQALKDEAELNTALSRLLNKKTPADSSERPAR